MSTQDFGGLIRRGRERLGLSHSRVAELIGRAPSTVRSWERGTSKPGDADVVSSLAAVLGIDEQALFVSAGIDPPVVEERPTVQQVLSTIAPPAERDRVMVGKGDERPTERTPAERVETLEPEEPATSDALRPPENPPAPVSATVATPGIEQTDSVIGTQREGRHKAERDVRQPRRPSEVRRATPVAAATPSTLPQAPSVQSYMENTGERLSYRLRNIYTGVGVVLLFIVLAWAASNLADSVGELWDILTSNL
ncbi:MAG: helix-turn-helix domain-containing protein [Acidimicrobiia bacterium]|nr:helix-turn-helix domain-containing protein [Acidimicrobiia bacterium]MDH4305849.1 helix-turn-helix domain-containing protein [Acidimicrobiia bacterium]MDH5293708.1 helix-turn-helix domain-containing protein [Acidimicrobiia bacterium]